MSSLVFGKIILLEVDVQGATFRDLRFQAIAESYVYRNIIVSTVLKDVNLVCRANIKYRLRVPVVVL